MIFDMDFSEEHAFNMDFGIFASGGSGGYVEIDSTLSKEGAAADAKAVGDAIAEAESLSNKTNIINDDNKTSSVKYPTVKAVVDYVADNSSDIDVDDTLSQQGKAADAKAVGDALAEKYTKSQDGIPEDDLSQDVQDKLNSAGEITVSSDQGAVQVKFGSGGVISGGGSGEGGGTIIGGVSSVNGKTGAVTLNAADVGALSSDTEIPEAYNDTAIRGLISAKYTKPSGGIPETDLAQAVKDKLNSGGTSVSGVSSVNGQSGAVTLSAADVGALPSDTEIPEAYDDTAIRGLISARYTKPSAGIPESDLAESIRTKLNSVGVTDEHINDLIDAKIGDIESVLDAIIANAEVL